MENKSKTLLESALRNMNYHDSTKWVLSEEANAPKESPSPVLIISVKHGNVVVAKEVFVSRSAASFEDIEQIYDRLLIDMAVDGLVKNKERLQEGGK